MPDTLGTQCRIDFVNFNTLRDRAIGTLRLTYIAVDAFVCNNKSHEFAEPVC